MIPATYPSVLDSSNRTKMLVYQVPSITGLTRWVDYIPVKSPASESDLTLANTYANEGFILTSKVNDITGLVPFKDYVPIYLDSTATKAWSADNDGYIPMSELAGLLLDFTTGALDPRIAFTRATNATVTNSAGVITYAPHNLLSYSEQFDNAAWGKTNITVTANSINSPNNTITADSIVEDTSTGIHRLVFSSTLIIGNSYTLSAYFKKANRNIILYLSDGVDAKGYAFNLTNGTTYPATGFSQATPNITPVEDGWFRCSITMVAAGTSASVQFRLDNGGGSGNYTGDGSVSLYTWGAQLEVGASPTTYNPTTVKNLLGFSELFDNAAWTKSNSFVQTNLLLYSEAFDNASWTKRGTATVTENTTIAPNGYQTADTLTNATDITYAGNNLDKASISLTSSTVYTYSIYIKGLTGTTAKIAIRDNSTGVITDSGAIALTSEWQRVSLSRTTGAATTSLSIIIGATNGTVAIWGAQLVQGSVAGDYRRTDAAALPVYYPNHNGVVCAEKLVENTAATSHYTFGNTTTFTASTPYVFSFYAKAAERTIVQAVPPGSFGSLFANFDLANGVVSLVGGGQQATITSVGNGWYRCAMYNTGAGATQAYVISTVTSASSARLESYTGDGTSGIYIFGAQLSDSASLDTYVLNAAAAPTAAAYYGARFDYDPVTLAPKGLLIEEQRSNNLLQSEDFSSVSWTKQNSSITSNTVLAPDGNTTADTLTADGTLATHWMFQTNATSATGKTISIYAKAGTNNFIQILFGGDSNPWANFNLATGEVGSTGTTVTASMKDSGNGWYRIIVSTTSTTANNPYFSIIQNATSGRGAGNSLTTTVHLWGAQSEIGAFATSYIPTAASQVTRSADVATIQGSNFYSWYNQNEGSIYAQAQSNNIGTGIYPTIVSISSGLSNNQISMLYLNSNTIFEFSSTVNSATQAAISVTGNAKPFYNKMAGGYKVNDFQFAVNNTLGTADTSGATPLVDTFKIGRLYNDTNNWNGCIKSISYYPQKLSSDVLKGLTA